MRIHSQGIFTGDQPKKNTTNHSLRVLKLIKENPLQFIPKLRIKKNEINVLTKENALQSPGSPSRSLLLLLLLLLLCVVSRHRHSLLHSHKSAVFNLFFCSEGHFPFQWDTCVPQFSNTVGL